MLSRKASGIYFYQVVAGTLREARMLFPIGALIGLGILVAANPSRSESLEFRGNTHTTLGQAALQLVGTPEAGTLVVSNVGTSGTDGVAIDLAQPNCNFELWWQNLPPWQSGDQLRFAIHGIPWSHGGGPYLGFVEVAGGNQALELRVDLPIGSGTNAVWLWLEGGGSHIEIIGESGVVATVGDWPSSATIGQTCSDVVSAFFQLGWEVPMTLRIGGTPYEVVGLEMFSWALQADHTQLRLELAGISEITLVEESLVTGTPATPFVPARVVLEPSYPNPFNPQTTIRYTLADAGFVSLEVLDTAGRHVATLASGHRPAGRYRVTWNGMDDAGARVASGVYRLRLEAGDIVRTSSVVLLK